MRDFGMILKKFRTIKAYGQSHLASEAGVVPSALADYERGAKSPKVEMREKLAHIMEVDPVELMGLELTEEDEIRILNKLLVKYCTSIGTIVENNTGAHKVIAVLPESFVPLQQTFAKYQEDILETRSMLEDASDKELEQSHDIKEAREELNFWLENWPEFDFAYQIKNNDVEATSAERTKFKENLDKKFKKRLNDYKKKSNNNE